MIMKIKDILKKLGLDTEAEVDDENDTENKGDTKKKDEGDKQALPLYQP